jgi:hypothetical protein
MVLKKYKLCSKLRISKPHCNPFINSQRPISRLIQTNIPEAYKVEGVNYLISFFDDNVKINAL